MSEPEQLQFQPTMHLKWFEVFDEREFGIEGHCPRAWTSGTRLTLKQWWTNGNYGEWRTVEFSFSEDPP